MASRLEVGLSFGPSLSETNNLTLLLDCSSSALPPLLSDCFASIKSMLLSVCISWWMDVSGSLFLCLGLFFQARYRDLIGDIGFLRTGIRPDGMKTGTVAFPPF